MEDGKRVAAPDAHAGHAHPPAAERGGAAFSPEFRAFEREMDAGMDRMMRDMHAPGYTGNVDVDFLAMMIPHHEGAVEMARLLLVHGRDPLTRQLASEIIASQDAEIAAMRRRLAILRRGEDSEPGGFPAMQGTRGDGSGR
ncbi:DUF305 domain-containing protein [Anaeromyxobacter oryzisoli]|jgi:DUF305 family protein family protein|uniref:DUF305 domain-containing protein n=1 Tax=Anaeromyxobacter oryzisoli TaxID=2925408 RepID=UPI001F580F3D|nr:DUF305 domain-containing protein [Anaeromyxobacter sp. SG63]